MSAPSLQQDIELAMRTGGLFFNGKRITSIKRVEWTGPSEFEGTPAVLRIVERVLVRGHVTHIDAEYGCTNPTPRDTSLCRRTFAVGASQHWGAWLDDPRCDVGNIAFFASARPRRCVSLFDDPSCEVAS